MYSSCLASDELVVRQLKNGHVCVTPRQPDCSKSDSLYGSIADGVVTPLPHPDKVTQSSDCSTSDYLSCSIADGVVMPPPHPDKVTQSSDCSSTSD
ncbi:hypothetical protein DPMN_147039 [Dreissena polymorpha]|uniref:Uncharacterized protein n=1 Tax=Dreissena polymorpha TaxID=45954 RepID=A0A9D4F734_DREPO|nr:hypothetical protein DPMN_147039 [Dreissena polymorpha]